MTRYFLRRLAVSALALWLLLTVVFVVVRLAPGGPAALYSNARQSAEQREALVRSYGLDRPLGEQYVRWISAVVLRWEWGNSFSQGRPVTEILGEAFPNTALLAGTVLVIQLSLSITLALLAAYRRESLLDHSIRAGSLLAFSIPTFWLGLMAILVFSSGLGWFPTGHMRSTDASSLSWGARQLDLLHHLALPALTLSVSSLGFTVRVLRASLLGVLGEDYIRTARAKGASERRVLWAHALPNTIGPLAQVVGLFFSSLLSGSLVTEAVFSWPGIGRVLFNATQSYDYPLIVAGTALSGALVVAGSFMADVVHRVADPRLRRA